MVDNNGNLGGIKNFFGSHVIKRIYRNARGAVLTNKIIKVSNNNVPDPGLFSRMSGEYLFRYGLAHVICFVSAFLLKLFQQSWPCP